MLTSDTLKNPQQEIRLFRQRILFITLLLATAFFILLGRLGYLQISQHKLYTTLSQKNQFSLEGLDPNRGLIYDRNGILLADNTPVFSLEIIPNRVSHLKQTINDLKKIVAITDEDIEQFDRQRSQHHRFEPTPIKSRLTEEELAKFSLDQYRFPGVILQAQLLRSYPLGELMAPVLGYVGRINDKELATLDPTNYGATNYIGKLGIEKYFEADLHGKAGYQQVETDAAGHVVRVVKREAPTSGKNLYLTIDSKLQRIAYDAFEYSTGGAVAIQPATGQVLVLVSKPSYNPNMFVTGISNKAFHTLQQDPNQPLYNRAVRGQYPFGSTIKPFMALAGLFYGVVTPDFKVYDSGEYRLPNSRHIYHGWKRGGIGWVNVQRAIMWSSDIYFFTLANRLGIQRMDDILCRFGFGQLTGIQMHEELPGLVPSPAWKARKQKQAWYPGDTIISGIGQGYMLTTPLQLANGVATIANRGQHMQPNLIFSMQDANGNVTKTLPIQLGIIKISPAIWDQVIQGMELVITGGTGLTHFGTHVAYTAAGKTGTAQVFSLKQNERYHKNLLPLKLRDNTLFIVFAPVENPQIAVAVIAEHTDIAGSVARKIVDAYLVHETTSPIPTPKNQATNTDND